MATCKTCKGAGTVAGFPCPTCTPKELKCSNDCTKCYVVTDNTGQRKVCSGSCKERSYTTNSNAYIVAMPIRAWPIINCLN